MDTIKWKTGCPTCVERDTDKEQHPCLTCGFPPVWPGVKPNNYVPDPEKIAALQAAAAVEEAEIEVEVEEEEPVELPWEELAGKSDEVLDPVGEVDETVLVEEPEKVPLEEQPPEDGRVPQVHIDDDPYYFCKKCKGRHKYASGIGKKHLGHKE